MHHRVRPLLMSVVLAAVVAGAAGAQDNPYTTVEGWARLPDGRAWGSTSAVYPAPDGRHIWVAERCGANTCAGRPDVNPILLFDASGMLVKSFGAGLIAWPHGIFVDKGGNVWVTDATTPDRQIPEGMGNVVYEFSADGALLMTLGTKGVAGEGPNLFRQPSDVLVAPNGDIFVADGHGADGNNRIVKFSPDGRFIKAWGATGSAPGEFRDPHALAMDSRGRLFVGDRANNRIQIFDQDGRYLESWTQFGRPSGIFIDRNDTMYVADSESNAQRSPGGHRGIRVGSARDGKVVAFIPDPEPDPDRALTSGAEGVAADVRGNIYGADVQPPGLRRYVRSKPR